MFKTLTIISKMTSANHNGLPIDSLACVECDLLMTNTTKLEHGQKLACSRCGHILARGTKDADMATLALSITALMLLIMSISSSFLAFEASGQSNSISLWTVADELIQSKFGILAFFIFSFMVLLPALYVISLIFLTLNQRDGLTTFPSITLAHTVNFVNPWIMGDVFIVGVLVGLIKVIGKADVSFGLSFWSYVVFTFVIIKITQIVDTHQLWAWVDNEH